MGVSEFINVLIYGFLAGGFVTWGIDHWLNHRRAKNT